MPTTWEPECMDRESIAEARREKSQVLFGSNQIGMMRAPMAGRRRPTSRTRLTPTTLLVAVCALGSPTSTPTPDENGWPHNEPWTPPPPTASAGYSNASASRKLGYAVPCIIAKGNRTGFFGQPSIRYGEAANPGPRQPQASATNLRPASATSRIQGRAAAEPPQGRRNLRDSRMRRASTPTCSTETTTTTPMH